MLGVDTGLALLLLSRHSFDLDGVPVEWGRSLYRGDRYKFVAHLGRGARETRERPRSSPGPAPGSARPWRRRLSRRSPWPGRRRVAVVKPAQTGVGRDEAGRRGRGQRGWRACRAADGYEVARFPDPLAPATAARVAGAPASVDRGAAPTWSARLAASYDLVLVEGAGGLLVRYADDARGVTTLADLATPRRGAAAGRHRSRPGHPEPDGAHPRGHGPARAARWPAS